MRHVIFTMIFMLLTVIGSFSQKDSTKITMGNITPEEEAKIKAEQKLDVFIPSGDYNILLFKMGSAKDLEEVKTALEEEGKKLGKNFIVHTYEHDLMIPKNADEARKTGHLVFANMMIWMDASKNVNYAEVAFKHEARFEDGTFPFNEKCITDMVLAHYHYNSANYKLAAEYFEKVVLCNEKKRVRMLPVGVRLSYDGRCG